MVDALCTFNFLTIIWQQQCITNITHTLRIHGIMLSAHLRIEKEMGEKEEKKIALTKNTSTEPKSNEMRIAYACTFGLLDFVLNRAQQPTRDCRRRTATATTTMMSTMSSLSSHFGSSVEYNLTSLIFRSFASELRWNRNPSEHFACAKRNRRN